VSIAFYASLPGGGIVSSVDEEGAYFNLANSNAGAFLGWLGFVDARTGAGLWGADPVPIPDLRRAVLRARNAGGEESWSREARIRGNFVEHGLPAEKLREYLDRFEGFLLEAEAAGAREVRWA
jgi:hypothetical protein